VKIKIPAAIFFAKKWRTKTHLFIPLVKTFASLTCEVAACRRVDVFLFTALRLHGGVAALIFSFAVIY
jgi:hypothetical protein